MTTESNVKRVSIPGGAGGKPNSSDSGGSRQGNRSGDGDKSQRSDDGSGGNPNSNASGAAPAKSSVNKNYRGGGGTSSVPRPQNPKLSQPPREDGARPQHQQQRQQQHEQQQQHQQQHQQQQPSGQSQKPPSRNRQRYRSKKPQQSGSGQDQNWQPQPQAAPISNEELLRQQAEAEATAAANAAAEEQERLLKLALDEEREKIRAINACVLTLETFHNTCANHQKFRDMFASPTKLAEVRTHHNATRKMLKSDLKKCTAFVKKVKTAASFQSTTTSTDFSNHPLIKDVATLNLSRYVEEIASSLLEAKLKVTDVPLVIGLCSALHERYEDFIPALAPKLISFIQSQSPNSSTSGGGAAEEEGGGSSVFKQRRVYLRMLTDFFLHGIITDPKPLIKIVGDAAGSPKGSSGYVGQQQQPSQYQVTDATLLTSFAKSAGSELLGVVSKTVRISLEDLKKELSQMDPEKQNEKDIAADQSCDDDGGGDGKEGQSSSPEVAPIVVDSALAELRTEKAKLLEAAEEVTNKLESSTITLRAIASDPCIILNGHCTGAYRTLCTSYVSTATKLRKLEKRCEQDRLLTGSLSEAREKGLADAQKLTDNLKKTVETLAEALDQDIPLIQADEEENVAASTGGTGVQLWTKAEDSGDGEGINLGPFEDEETRSFYCDLPDFLSTKPPALLGLTPEQVEEKKARNAIKYGTFGMSSDESGEYLASSSDGICEANMERYGKDEPGEGIKDASTADQDSSVDKDTPHYKLKVLLEEEICECNRREVTDELADKFCVNHGSSKSSRKRLTAALFSVPRTRLDLLSQYARFAAIVDRVFDDIAPPLLSGLEAQFHGQAKFKKNQNIEGRLKNARFIGELTKFRVAPPIVSLNCLQRCVDDFSGPNIDVACCLLESCGRYLYRTVHSKERLSKLLDTMLRLRKAKNLDERSIALLESAFFMVNPPQKSTRKLAKVYPPLEAYIQHLLLVKLTLNDAAKSLVTKQILRLPWGEPSAQCGALVSKYMVKACLSGKYGTTCAVLEVAAALKKSRREIIVKMVDAVLEDLKWSMENPTFRHQQRAIGLARVLGHLYVASLVNSSMVFEQLNDFVNFGHKIPAALLEASKTQFVLDETSAAEGGGIGSSAKFPTPPPISNAIPEEDDEAEAINEVGGQEGQEEGRAEEAKPPESVPISRYSKYDPRVPCAFDPPTAILRIKLICSLLESAGPSIANSMDLSKLKRFLASFQRYLFTKHSLPAEVKFALLDLFDSLESHIKAVTQVKDSKKGKKNKKLIKDDNAGDHEVFVRYTSWMDAHGAVITYEEAEAKAESRARDRLILKGGGEIASDQGRISTKMEGHEDGIVMEGDEFVGDSDESVSEDESESDSASSAESMEGDDEDLDSQEVPASDGDHESQYDESEEEMEEEEGEEYVEEVVEEEEVDPVAAEEAYMRQLEQEELEREIRKLTLEAVEKGKIAARAGTGGKVAANMVHASQFVGKKAQYETTSTAMKAGSPAEGEEATTTVLGCGGVALKLLKRGHKGRVEAKQLVVPEDTSLAQRALKHGDEEAKERDLLKSRVLQYELESSEQSSGNVYMDQAKLQVIRNRPLSMEDIDRNFGTTGGSRFTSAGRGGIRAPSGRGRGRGGRTLKFY